MPVAEVMTYDSLVDDISTYLERTDDATLEKIPTFIMLAEQILAMDLKFLGNLTVAESKWSKTTQSFKSLHGGAKPFRLMSRLVARNFRCSCESTST
jgi:hypothetical protein